MAPKRKMKTMRRKKAVRRRAGPRKAIRSINGSSVKAGLVSQALCYDPNTIGTINMLNESAPIPGQYTGGPLSIGGGSSATGLQSFFTVNGVAGYGYDFGAAFTHMAGDLQRWNDIRIRYDLYRIRKVQVKIEYLYNAASGGLGETTMMPSVFYSIDRDDAGIPAVASSLTGRADCKKFQFGRGKALTISYKPVARAELMASMAAGYSPKASPWIDTINGAFVPHFGLKMWFVDCCLPGNNDNGSVFRLTYHYWIDFKGTQNIY